MSRRSVSRRARRAGFPPGRGRAAALGLAVSLSVLAGCRGPREVELAVPGLPLEDLWNSFAEVSARVGHPIDRARSDRGRRYFVSKWRERPMAFGEGRRTRVHAFFEREDDVWTVSFYCERERVKNPARALQPTEDDWKSAGQEPVVEQTIRAQLALAYDRDLELQRPSGNPFQRDRR